MGVLACEYVGIGYRIVMPLITCLNFCSQSKSSFVIFYITFSSKESNKKERKMEQNQKGPVGPTYIFAYFSSPPVKAAGHSPGCCPAPGIGVEDNRN